MFVALCSVFQAGAVGHVLGPNFGRILINNREKSKTYLYDHPAGDSGDGPDCHVPQEIGGFGPILARIWGETYFVFHVGLAQGEQGGRWIAP